MRIRSLGWAGVEIMAQDEHVVVDPLNDTGAVFAWLGDRLAAIPLPEVVPAAPGAVAGVVTSAAIVMVAVFAMSRHSQ